MAITFPQAAEILKAGGIVAYPTETVYGLACRIDRPDSIARLKALKGRDGSKPILIAVQSVRAAGKYAHADRKMLSFLKEILPGPVAVLLRKKRTVPDSLAGKSGLVGIRVPASAVARRLASVCGAITSTSANPAGSKPAKTAGQAEKLLGLKSVLAGSCRYGAPSTLFNPATGEILRQGAYPAEKLLRLWRKHFGR